MNTLLVNPSAVEPAESGMVRLGGIAALLIGMACILIIALFASVGAPPELAVNWAGYAALIMLSQEYAAATSDAQRAILVATAS